MLQFPFNEGRIYISESFYPEVDDIITVRMKADMKITFFEADRSHDARIDEILGTLLVAEDEASSVQYVYSGMLERDTYKNGDY